MRVAITPHELWYDGLEQAAQKYTDAKDISSMMKLLTDLHDAMNDNVIHPTKTAIVAEGFSESIGKIGRTTLRDISFRHSYCKSLSNAQLWLEQFRITGRTTDLHQAWEIYQQIFKKIKVQISNLKKLELHHVSPALTTATDLILSVPGSHFFFFFA
jgi:FKBP12-rapamycin complex-associated protein